MGFTGSSHARMYNLGSSVDDILRRRFSVIDMDRLSRNTTAIVFALVSRVPTKTTL